jgi:formamidopyrimidine-DNA glycosylase
MIELPEATILARQINAMLPGKRIIGVEANHSPHAFAWYYGDPALYYDLLADKAMGRARSVGGYVEIEVGDRVLAIGAPLRYHERGERRPVRHQLLLEFTDGTALSACLQMWGGFLCCPWDTRGGTIDYEAALAKPSPLSDGFDRAYFDGLFDEQTPRLSAKAFLATEQRIPGLGNGVLQDILWQARVHPRRKMGDLSAAELNALYAAVKSVPAVMADEGGRDTETDLYGCPGRYWTRMCKNTLGLPCPACGAPIQKAAYMGGSIYFCPVCQAL